MLTAVCGAIHDRLESRGWNMDSIVVVKKGMILPTFLHATEEVLNKLNGFFNPLSYIFVVEMQIFTASYFPECFDYCFGKSI